MCRSAVMVWLVWVGAVAWGEEPRPELVALKTQDEVAIEGELYRVGVEAPTVIGLPMYRQARASLRPIVDALVSRGLNVLLLDLRGHGASAPELASRVERRDAALFNAMHLDVTAARRWLHQQGFDTSRLGLLGASVGCSVAATLIARDPGPYRIAVLMTPGASYLGVDTLADARRWPGTPLLILTARDEARFVDPVRAAFVAACGDRLDYEVIAVDQQHGSQLFAGEAVCARVAAKLATALGEQPLVVLPRTGAIQLERGPLALMLDGENETLRLRVELSAGSRLVLELDRSTLTLDGSNRAVVAGMPGVSELPVMHDQAASVLVLERARWFAGGRGTLRAVLERAGEAPFSLPASGKLELLQPSR